MSKLQTLLNQIQELEIQVQELTRMLHEIQVQNDLIYFEKESPFKEGEVKMISGTIFKDIQYNGRQWVADFEDGGKGFSLNIDDLRLRIENLKKNNQGYMAEAIALVLLEFKIKEEPELNEC